MVVYAFCHRHRALSYNTRLGEPLKRNERQNGTKRSTSNGGAVHTPKTRHRMHKIHAPRSTTNADSSYCCTFLPCLGIQPNRLAKIYRRCWCCIRRAGILKHQRPAQQTQQKKKNYKFLWLCEWTANVHRQHTMLIIMKPCKDFASFAPHCWCCWCRWWWCCCCCIFLFIPGPIRIISRWCTII